MAIIINMPGGATQEVDTDDLFWMRNAFTHEWKGAVMVRLAREQIYSSESLDGLKEKFLNDGAKVAVFTPPEGKLDIVVNTGEIENIEPSNPIIYHEKARAILRFDSKVALAVRESVEECGDIIKRAGG